MKLVTWRYYVREPLGEVLHMKYYHVDGDVSVQNVSWRFVRRRLTWRCQVESRNSSSRSSGTDRWFDTFRQAVCESECGWKHYILGEGWFGTTRVSQSREPNRRPCPKCKYSALWWNESIWHLSTILSKDGWSERGTLLNVKHVKWWQIK